MLNNPIFVFVGALLGLVWFIFPFAVIQGISKQRAANRLLLADLAAIRKQMEHINLQLTRANEIQGDLIGAAQWFVDRAASPPIHELG